MSVLQNLRSPEEFEDIALTALEKVFRASGSTVLDWTPFTQGARKLHDEDMFFHKKEQYPGLDYSKVHHEDPLFKWIQSGRCQEDLNVTRLSDLCTMVDIRNTDFYNRILLPLNCRYVLTMAAHYGGSILASISMLRSPSEKDFNRSDILSAQLITPILASTYSNLVLRQKKNEREDIFNIISQPTQTDAIIIFSSDLRSVFRTDGMTILGKQLSKYGDTLRDIFSASTELHRYISSFSSNERSHYRRIPKKTQDIVKVGQHRILIVLEGFMYGGDKRYLKAELKLVSQKATLQPLEGTFGLTQRESQIAQLVARGHATKEIGELLAISPWSVKNHLQNIYRKVGINSRVLLAELIHRIGL